MSPSKLFSEVLANAISEVKRRQVPVFTFALYHDHESKAVSVCVDTEENSGKVVRSIVLYLGPKLVFQTSEIEDTTVYGMSFALQLATIVGAMLVSERIWKLIE
ncbi:hypothetical protein [Roseateles toxinivorans]|uniref:Uncharacterized protein n=1 Tax=Roseateles toxinivorans TaxID=270368 RepID=A0A4R6QGG4_9BURK|nr:hypothetical protein [Roseateles toxinivorans]TDP61420.1 hypothetical protein DES47_113103 [Roseateles toxinivorans]